MLLMLQLFSGVWLRSKKNYFAETDFFYYIYLLFLVADAFSTCVMTGKLIALAEAF
jgi:hypothetical protein